MLAGLRTPNKNASLILWEGKFDAAGKRNAKPDPSWVQPRKPPKNATSVSMPVGGGSRRCTGSATDCSCRSCVLARWTATAPAHNRRVGVRVDARSSWSSASEDEDAEQVEEEESTSGRVRSYSAPPFCGFDLVASRDAYAPTSGFGPTLLVEARQLSSGVEKTVTVDGGLKLSVLEREGGPDAMPDRLLTVSKRPERLAAPPDPSAQRPSFEIIYTRRTTEEDQRGFSRHRATSLDEHAHAHAQASRPVERGDAAAVRAALERAARLYGTNAHELVDAVVGIAPDEMRAPLAGLCC